MKFTRPSLLAATSFCFLLLHFATVIALQMPGRPNDFIVKTGGTFTCDMTGSRCQVTGDFVREDIARNGGQLTNVLGGPQWVAQNVTTDSLTVPACIGDNCIVTCQFGCECTKPDGKTACPFVVVTLAPTMAPTIVGETETEAPSQAPVSADSGATTTSTHWQSSTGIMLTITVASVVFGL